jgi:hypothetical protein
MSHYIYYMLYIYIVFIINIVCIIITIIIIIIYIYHSELSHPELCFMCDDMFLKLIAWHQRCDQIPTPRATSMCLMIGA